jgi:hypothetical protein
MIRWTGKWQTLRIQSPNPDPEAFAIKPTFSSQILSFITPAGIA